MQHLIKKQISIRGQNIVFWHRAAQPSPEKLVLIHGNASAALAYLPLVGLLPYQLFFYDQRGFGESSLNQDIFSLKQFALDLEAFLQKLGLDQVILVGWSFGSAVVLKYLTQWKDRVKKVILIGSVPADCFPTLNKQGKAITSLQQAKTCDKCVMMENLVKSKDQKILAKIFKNLVLDCQKTAIHFETMVQQSLTQRNYPSVVCALAQSLDVSKVSVPVMVMQGSKDVLLPAQKVREGLSSIKNLNFQIIEGGHMLPFQSPQKVAQLIISFIS